jgi:hypothetical protein
MWDFLDHPVRSPKTRLHGGVCLWYRFFPPDTAVFPARHFSINTLYSSRYALEGSGIESRWVGIFCTRLERPWGLPSLLYNGYRVFPGGKAARAWRWPPPSSSAEVKERVGLYLYSPSGPLWHVLGWDFVLYSSTTTLITRYRIILGLASHQPKLSCPSYLPFAPSNPLYLN